MDFPTSFSILEESEQLDQEVTTEIIAFLNHDGNILQFVGGEQIILGVSTNELIGKKFVDLFPSILLELGDKLLIQALREGHATSRGFKKNAKQIEQQFEIKLFVNGPDELIIIIRIFPLQASADKELLRLNRALLNFQSASLSITTSLDYEYILETFAWELTNLLDAEGCMVSNWKQKNNTISILAAYPTNRKWWGRSTGDSFSLTQFPLTEQILLEKMAYQIVMADSPPKLSEHAYMKRANIDVLLMLPLIYQNQTIGLVEVIGRQEKPFSNSEISLGQLLTNEAASALVNARLYNQLNQRLKENSALKKISQAAVSTLDTTNILNTVTNGAFEVLMVEAVSVALVENDGKHFLFAAASGTSSELIKGKRFSLEEGAVGQVIRQGEALMLRDQSAVLHHDQLFSQKIGIKVHSIMVAPLQTKGQIIGAMCAINKLEGQFSSEDMQLLISLSNPTATAIENARLYERARREIEERQKAETALKKERALLAQRVEERTITLRDQYKRLQALTKIESTITYHGGLNSLLQQIVHAADTALPMDGGASIILWDKDDEDFYVGWSSENLHHKETPVNKWKSGGASKKILESQEVLVVSDINFAPYGASDWLKSSGIQSYIGLPLIGQGESLGILYMLSFEQREFSEEEIDFLKVLANRAANGISNVKLYETLQQTNAELTRVSTMKDEFLASMSHELRTPLNAILGVSEGLIEEYYGSLNNKQTESVQIISESGSHLLDLINDILDVTKIESGQLMLEIESVFIKSICESSIQYVRQTALKKQISISMELDERVQIIKADGRRIKQILINLLSNAVKFTPKGGKIGLELKGDPTASMVHLTVWDTGIGIKEEDLNRLFKPFSQLDSKLSRRYTGTGLGLALVKYMTELHDGRVTTQSELGVGSRFTVSLPWQQVNKDSSDQSHADLQGENYFSRILNPTKVSSDGQSKILLVDDDAVNINLFKELLIMSGFAVETADNGKKALQFLQEEKVDLVLMDIQMPEMDGLETIQRIRSQHDKTELPIIALTALAMESDRINCMEAGANDYLSKPVTLQKLIKSIQTVLDNR